MKNIRVRNTEPDNFAVERSTERAVFCGNAGMTFQTMLDGKMFLGACNGLQVKSKISPDTEVNGLIHWSSGSAKVVELVQQGVHTTPLEERYSIVSFNDETYFSGLAYESFFMLFDWQHHRVRCFPKNTKLIFIGPEHANVEQSNVLYIL